MIDSCTHCYAFSLTGPAGDRNGARCGLGYDIDLIRLGNGKAVGAAPLEACGHPKEHKEYMEYYRIRKAEGKV